MVPELARGVRRDEYRVAIWQRRWIPALADSPQLNVAHGNTLRYGIDGEDRCRSGSGMRPCDVLGKLPYSVNFDIEYDLATSMADFFEF